MKVAVAVHGRFHGFDLAAQLHRRGMLARLLTTYPAFAVRRFLPADTPLATAPWLEAWRRLPLPGPTDLAVARAFGRFAAAALPPADIAVGWSGASLEMIARARALGARVVIERGSTHIDHQSEVLAEAHAAEGLAWHATDPRLAERERREYAQADRIMVGSRSSAESFVARGVPADRLVVNPYGVDLARFAATHGRQPGPPRVLFVGSVGVRKGVPWLLRAFATLPAPWELHLVGPVEPGFEAVFRRLPMERVVLRGPLPGAALPAEYAAADLFCLPSVEEGFGMVILQALASGLPVVASTATGLADADPLGRAGRLVRPADTASLADALRTLAGDQALRAELAARARPLVQAGFSWDDYGARAVAAYEALLSSGPGRVATSVVTPSSAQATA